MSTSSSGEANSLKKGAAALAPRLRIATRVAKDGVRRLFSFAHHLACRTPPALVDSHALVPRLRQCAPMACAWSRCPPFVLDAAAHAAKSARVDGDAVVKLAMGSESCLGNASGWAQLVTTWAVSRQRRPARSGKSRGGSCIVHACCWKEPSDR